MLVIVSVHWFIYFFKFCYVKLQTEVAKIYIPITSNCLFHTKIDFISLLLLHVLDANSHCQQNIKLYARSVHFPICLKFNSVNY